MDESQNIRCSSRRRIRPVEFWNFEKPEESVNEIITYNQSELTRCSVFQPFSCSYQVTPRRVSTSKGTKGNQTATGKNDNTTLRNVAHSTNTQRQEGEIDFGTASRENTTHPANSQGKKGSNTIAAVPRKTTTQSSKSQGKKRKSDLGTVPQETAAHSSKSPGKKGDGNLAAATQKTSTDSTNLQGKKGDITIATVPRETATHSSKSDRKGRKSDLGTVPRETSANSLKSDRKVRKSDLGTVPQETSTHSSRSQGKESDSTDATVPWEAARSSKPQGMGKGTVNQARLMLQTAYPVTSQVKEGANQAKPTLHNAAHSSEPQGKTEMNGARPPQNRDPSLASSPGENETSPTLAKMAHPSQPSQKRKLENGEAEEEVARLSDEDPGGPAKPPGKRWRLKSAEGPDKATRHTDECTHTSKLPLKPDNREPLRSTEGLPLGDRQGCALRLPEENGREEDKEQTRKGKSAKLDVLGLTNPHKKRKRDSDADSSVCSDEPTSSQTQKGRKRNEQEDPQAKETVAIPTPLGEGLNGKDPTPQVNTNRVELKVL